LIRCTSGCFFGVNDRVEDHLPGKLKAAYSSALSLQQFFQEAYPEGRWKLHPNSRGQQVSRSQFLAVIHQWVPSVEPESAGILYFAGHGVQCKEDSVLCLTDFDADLPYDTGVPVFRIADIIKKYGHRDARFVLILDACREGEETRDLASIPENIVVVYGCQAGRRSIELTHSSVLIKSLLRVATASEKFLYHNRQYICLARLLQALSTELLHAPESCLQEVDVNGVHLEDIYLPSVPSSGSGTVPDGWLLPKCYLLRSEPSSALFNEISCAVGKGLIEWLGYDNVQLDGILRYGNLDFGSNGERISLRLPALRHYEKDPSFLDHMLTRCQDIFYLLNFQWYGKVSDTKFRISPLFKDCIYTTLNNNQSLVIWNAGPLKGQALITHAQYPLETVTSLDISCQTREGTPMPIEYLMPSLNSIYSFFARIQARRHND
jgi:hypothetical protein